jgi:4-amino-4-deoxy-L-arabinose transferase-like glycosyltransferase
VTPPQQAVTPESGGGAVFADGLVASRTERRAALLVIAAAVVVFVLALAIAPPTNATYDDAKYVGIGRNVLEGNGPRNVFGSVFLKHSPVWPVLIVLPEQIAGIHPIDVGHFVNALSGVAILLMVGALGWRVRPALGGLGAASLVGLPYFSDIGRTAGIDLPSIAITFGYLLVGFAAVRRNSMLLAALAGLLFGLGFVIKETILPFAPVPFLAAILWDIPWRSILRLTAVTVALAAVGCGWWLVMYASYTGEVYRVGYGAWTLVPAAIATALFVILGLAAEPLARRFGAGDRAAAVMARAPVAVREHRRSIVAWGMAIAWVVLLLWVFNGTSKLQGSGLFNLTQIRSYVGEMLRPVGPAFALGVGSVLAFASLIRDPATIGREARALLLAVVCGIPLVMLVVGVGEAPRHYIGELALLALTGWMGWIDGAYRAVIRRDRVALVLAIAAGAAAFAIVGLGILRQYGRIGLIGSAAGLLVVVVVALAVFVWLERRGRLWSTGPALLLAAALLLSMGSTLGRASGLRGTVDSVETLATQRAVEWIEDNLPAGSVVGIGPYLSMGTAIDLPAGYRAVMIRHFLAIGDPAEPLGLRAGARGADHDWIAVDVAPGKANQFLVYEAERFNGAVEKNRPAVYVFNLTRDRSALSVLGALTEDNGFEEIASWSYPAGSDTIETHIFGIDQERFGIDPNELFISPEALDRLAGMLERQPEEGSRAAAGLLSRIVRPADGSLDAGLARLEALAGG